MSESSLYVGLVTFLAMIPRVIIPPFTGYLADRYERRKVMATIYGLNLTHTLFLAGLLAFGQIEMWHLMILAFVNGAARSAQMPVGQALVPNLVPKDKLLNAIALNQATMHGSRLLGPLTILPLLESTRIEWAFLACSMFYVVSLVQSLRIKTPSTGSMDNKKGFFSNFTQGLPYVYRHPLLKLIVMMAFFHCGFTMSFEAVLPVLSVERFNATDGADFSLMMMSIGGGALISLIWLSGVTSETTKGKLFLNLGVISGLAPILLAFSPNIYFAIGSAALMGASQAGYMTLTHTMIQLVTDDSVRGRVGAVYSVHIGGIMASMNLANGAISDLAFLKIDLFNGLRVLLPADTMLTIGGILFIATVFISWFIISLRKIYQTGIPQSSLIQA
tara:strand:+ start:4103 stop:5269 length:1167 start_codon:yes stop_codon:yes gene_type:complete